MCHEDDPWRKQAAALVVFILIRVAIVLAAAVAGYFLFVELNILGLEG